MSKIKRAFFMPKQLNVKKIAQLTGHNGSIFSIVEDEQPNRFLSGGGDGWIVRWDLNEPDLGKLVAKVDQQIFALRAIPDQNLIIAGNMNGGLHWIRTDDLEKNKNISHHHRGVFDILPVHDAVLTIGGSGVLTKWSLDPIRSLESIQLSHYSLRSIDYSATRNEIAIGASDHSIFLLDAGSLALKKVLPKAHSNSVFAVKYHPNNSLLLSGGRDAHLRVWDLKSDFREVSTQPAHWFTINSIVFDPTGRWFATGSRDKTIKIWDAANFKLLKVLETVRDKGHLNSVNRLYWSTFGNYLLSCSDDRSIIAWEVTKN